MKCERGIEMKRLIYAEDAMQNVMDEIRYKESLYTSTVYSIAKKAIGSAPTIESNRLSAEWIYLGYGEWQCPVCKSIYGYGKDFKYCPECGTRMVSANESL